MVFYDPNLALGDNVQFEGDDRVRIATSCCTYNVDILQTNKEREKYKSHECKKRNNCEPIIFVSLSLRMNI